MGYHDDIRMNKSSIAALIVCSLIIILIVLFMVLHSRNASSPKRVQLPPGYYAAPPVTNRTEFPSSKTSYPIPRTTILREGQK